MAKAENLNKKKDLGKPYSSLSKKKLKNTQEKERPFVLELERLITETMNTESQNVTNEEPQLPLFPRCPIDKSELKPYKAQKTGEQFFKCRRVGCGVMCFEKDLLGYCEAVLQKLHSTFTWDAPVCGCGKFTLLSVSKSEKNFMIPYFRCAQRNKEDGCNFFQWGNQRLSNKNLQISNEIMKQQHQREEENREFLQAQKNCLSQNAVQDL